MNYAIPAHWYEKFVPFVLTQFEFLESEGFEPITEESESGANVVYRSNKRSLSISFSAIESTVKGNSYYLLIKNEAPGFFDSFNPEDNWKYFNHVDLGLDSEESGYMNERNFEHIVSEFSNLIRSRYLNVMRGRSWVN